LKNSEIRKENDCGDNQVKSIGNYIFEAGNSLRDVKGFWLYPNKKRKKLRTSNQCAECLIAIGGSEPALMNRQVFTTG
jgi:hypothetical protein